MFADKQPEIRIRPATAEDAPVCGKICYDAFFAISQAHGFPCDLPSAEVATGILSMLFSAPDFYCIVAEIDGRIAGSNVLDERSIIYGVGPITIDPTVQNQGTGRKLMQAVLDRAAGQGLQGCGWCRLRFITALFRSIPRSDSMFASPLPVCRGGRKP